VAGNLEYRFPLWHVERGPWSFPTFVRHLHGAVFADAADAFDGAWHVGDLKTSAGASLGTDLFLGHGLPLTATATLAHGFAAEGDTRAYFRLGLAF